MSSLTTRWSGRGIHSQDGPFYQLIDQELTSEKRSKVEVDAPWKNHLPAGGENVPDLADMPLSNKRGLLVLVISSATT